jgi:hypothetical protein
VIALQLINYYLKRNFGETVELTDFDDILYKVEGNGEKGKGDYYLLIGINEYSGFGMKEEIG